MVFASKLWQQQAKQRLSQQCHCVCYEIPRVVDGFPMNIHVRYLSLSTDIHDDAFKLLVDE